MENQCRTRYPILLVHGFGFRDRKYLNYWGRIPKTLESRGAAVFYGHQDSWGTIEENALCIQKSLLRALEETGAEKVNIIAHSKGGLDARYLISSLNMGEQVASLTTVSTPHHGSKTMDKLYRLPKWLFRTAGRFVDLYFRILGDKSPNFAHASYQVTTSACDKFNEDNPDCAGVYYQSYGVSMKRPTSDMIMILPRLVVGHFDGESDGIVAVSSAVWGNDKGVVRPSGNRGISHADIVDIRRHNCGAFDPREFYAGIVADLKEKGL